ncbi:hypothetical protein NSTC745_00310 [Nostoc sp. DSM 114161]|jgi:uncharacterized protein (DUF433 family)
MNSRADLLTRITQTPGQCGGHPCIRGMRIRVSDILEMLAENVSISEILEDFPDLQLEDIQACLLFAAIAKIEAAKDFMQQVRRRINELQGVFECLNECAILGIQELESLPSFDKNRDAKKFQKVALFVKALAEIMKTPVLDSEGQLNPTTATIQAKYRTLGGN